MPTINPALVPTISPGNLFNRFTTDITLNIRWVTPNDPVHFEAQNRPMVDIALRQLILAKAIDNLELRLSHQALFPFLIPPKILINSVEYDLPFSWIWDMHDSLPSKWEFLRLMKIMRISGNNHAGSTGGKPDGILRFVFSAQLKGSTQEVALFFADYNIGSLFTYQYVKISPATNYEYNIFIDSTEADTLAGFVIFRTLDLNDSNILSFIDLLEPPAVPTDSNSDGIFDNPTSYYFASSTAGGSTINDDFQASSLSHGTGTLVLSAFNLIPAADSDFNLWLSSNNYPFRLTATRASINGIVIPKAIFREFNIIAPSPDEPTDDSSKLNSPVWLSSIERIDTLATKLKFVFSTYSISNHGNPPIIIEFATLVLERSFLAGRIVGIETLADLYNAMTSDAVNFQQGFGTGHVVLSSLWGASTGEINVFFDKFLPITDVPPLAVFTEDSGILSSFGVGRVPRTVPTLGQSEALVGTGAYRSAPLNPSGSNRFVTELDEGLGDPVDFRTLVNFPDALRENPDINPIGYSASRIHKSVVLIIDAAGKSHDYEKDILPRLKCLFGRNPIVFDIWWDGTYFKMYSPNNSWITL